MWNGTITTDDDKKFCITTGGGNWLDTSLRIALNKKDLEELTDNELIKVLRDFQNKAYEIELLGIADECHWSTQYLKTSDLMIIANSKLATDDQRNNALILLKNPLARINQYEVLERNRKKSGYIYLLQDQNFSWHYKIGMSINPKKRVRQIGFALLIYYFPTDDMIDSERQLHSLYQNQRTEGEWFKLYDSNLEYIQSIKEYKNGDFIIMENRNEPAI